MYRASETTIWGSLDAVWYSFSLIAAIHRSASGPPAAIPHMMLAGVDAVVCHQGCISRAGCQSSLLCFRTASRRRDSGTRRSLASLPRRCRCKLNYTVANHLSELCSCMSPMSNDELLLPAVDLSHALHHTHRVACPCCDPDTKIVVAIMMTLMMVATY
eukprot:scaffold166843_cov35-Prasinocladus_malaysianus.AAC.3